MERRSFFEGVYALLVKHAGASNLPGIQAQFVGCFSRDPATREYRFGGKLGFGGKFRAHRVAPYVDCYLEDRTPEVEAAMSATNEALTLYVAEHGYPT